MGFHGRCRGFNVEKSSGLCGGPYSWLGILAMTGHCDDYSAMSMAELMLKRHKGLRLKPYLDTLGKLTIGYGRNLDDRGITEMEAQDMLARDVKEARDDLATFPFWNDLNSQRKAALIDMRYCLGFAGFREFEKTIAALNAGDYYKAADEIEDPLFAKQVKGRAKELADMLR